MRQLSIPMEVERFLSENCSKIIGEKTTYYYLPYWIKDDKLGWFMMGFNELPDELQKLIIERREPIDKFTKIFMNEENISTDNSTQQEQV